MGDLSKEQILTLVIIVVAVVVAALLLFLVIFLLIRKAVIRNNFKKYSAKLIYNIALDNDFYLINDLLMPLNDEEHMHIDHLLFGDKYIYVISTRKYSYPVKGKLYDNSWVYVKKSKVPTFVDNPLLMNKKRAEKLALVTHFNQDFIKNVVVVNNEAFIENGVNDDFNILTTYSKLKKVIKHFESLPVKRINKDDLAKAVKDIARLNDR